MHRTIVKIIQIVENETVSDTDITELNLCTIAGIGLSILM